jgi:predicted ArsR family transcriptional regulator
MQATRQQILDFLRERGAAGVRDLGVHLDLTATGVRQHLTVLEREGLVTASEVRGRVGRPALAYRLTTEGEARYPKGHERMLAALLATLERRLPETELRAVMAETAAALAIEQPGAARTASPADRVAAACEALRGQHTLAEWTRDVDGFLLNARTCPYDSAGGTHPATCEMDVAYIGAITGMAVELVAARQRGDEACCFRLTPRGSAASVEA